MNSPLKQEMMFKVKGRSMYPTLLEGDIVTINMCEVYNIDDILVLINNGNFMIHRVINVMLRYGVTYYLTKGDNNNFIDRWFPDKLVIGKVVEIKNYFI